MIKNWKTVVFIASLAINLAVIVTFGFLWAADKDNPKKPPYTEKELEEFKMKRWTVKIILDTTQLKYPAVQYAIFDHDPIPDFRKIVSGSVPIYNEMMKGKDNETRKSYFRLAAIRNRWDQLFKNIGGDKVQMITCRSVNAHTSDGKSGKIWLVTKCQYHHALEPICWCIPVQPEIGKEITVLLNKATVFDVAKEFDLAITEGNKK